MNKNKVEIISSVGPYTSAQPYHRLHCSIMYLWCWKISIIKYFYENKITYLVILNLFRFRLVTRIQVFALRKPKQREDFF